MRPLPTARLSFLAAASLLLGGCVSGRHHDLETVDSGTFWPPVPTVIAHRGASAFRPEHTLAAYQKAIDDGADAVEPDLVMTKDAVLIARHENELSVTTDVASRGEFASRKTTKLVDGIPVAGWFTEDFTLAEIKTLRVAQPVHADRLADAPHQDPAEIPTLQEVVDLVRRQSETKRRTVGIYPETKHPTYFRAIGLPMETPLVNLLAANGYKDRSAPVFIQSFEVSSLKALRTMTQIRLVQLIGNVAACTSPKGGPCSKPYDFKAANDARTYADLVTPAGLREIALYADAVAPHKEVIIPRTADNSLGAPTAFIAAAHAAGLRVHTWTFRPGHASLPLSAGSDSTFPANGPVNSVAEITAYLRTGIDGFFTDDVAAGREAVSAFVQANTNAASAATTVADR